MTIKHFFFLSLLISIFMVSCNGLEERAFTHPEILTIIADNASKINLNLYDNEFSVYAILNPAVGDSALIHVYSDSDTIGFTCKVNTTDYYRQTSSEEYYGKKLIANFGVAAFTDSVRKCIKVSYGYEIVYVDVNYGEVKTNLIFKGDDVLSITYWSELPNSEVPATLFIHCLDYSDTTLHRVNIWTDRAPSQLSYDLYWNNPNQYQELPSFNSHYLNVYFKRNSNSTITTIGVGDQQKVYVRYNGVIYESNFNQNENSILIPMIR